MCKTLGGWQWTYQVKVDVAEPTRRNGNLDRFDVDIGLYLGLLAIDAVANPGGNVSVHCLPKKPTTDEGCPDSRVSDVVD